jgi:hypothetical protein
MNRCSFFGKLNTIHHISNSVDCVELILEIESKRKGNNDIKKMDYENLHFMAWGTAAISILKNIQIGDYMLVIDATARNDKGKGYFRINEFKIIKRGN